jgi:hypothetical protein
MTGSRGDTVVFRERLPDFMSGFVGLGAVAVGWQLDTLGRDFDDLSASPNHKGHA